MLKNRFLLISLCTMLVSLTSLCQEAKFKGFVVTDTLAYREDVSSTYDQAPYLTDEIPGFTTPVAIQFQQPQYPLWELSEQIEGDVVLKALISKEGKVQRAVVQQSAHKAMSRSAIEAIVQSTFTPAKKDSVPIDVWIRVAYSFKIK